MSKSDERIDLSVPCAHVEGVKVHHIHRPPPGCEDCLKIGGEWVHLRVCLTCGHVGCCDSSPHRNATAHCHATKQRMVGSGEVGENWAYSYADDQFLSAG